MKDDQTIRADVPDTNVGDTISRQAAINALWKALYMFEDEMERKFQESDELDVRDWGLHRIFVQAMSDVDRQIILTLHSAEPRWIPVTERLPDDLAEVNVTWVNHKPESYYESIKDEPFTATAVFYKGKWYWWTTYTQDLLAEYGERCNVGLMDEAIEVTAWMPLPEPWEET